MTPQRIFPSFRVISRARPCLRKPTPALFAIGRARCREQQRVPDRDAGMGAGGVSSPRKFAHDGGMRAGGTGGFHPAVAAPEKGRGDAGFWRAWPSRLRTVRPRILCPKNWLDYEQARNGGLCSRKPLSAPSLQPPTPRPTTTARRCSFGYPTLPSSSQLNAAVRPCFPS